MDAPKLITAMPIWGRELLRGGDWREVGKPIKLQPTDNVHLEHAMLCPDVIYVAFRIFY